ncbi:hypothetical protein [Xanthomonas albilineans]|uniref:hypothetical protein n=1 Tax=Xanthomonas albilineans TaxID=29447 RepID=UPI0005F354D4|nr:hypothetical protein [Xanthomonas albilineans]
MLFRFHDCAIYDSDREPLTTVWIEAANEREAAVKAETMLSLVWDVSAERVCIQAAAASEYDALANCLEGDDAGDRRLWATGSWGERPLYYPPRVLIFAGARKRARLLAAFRAAQAHARELAAAVEAEAVEMLKTGKEREAGHHAYEAGIYREFAAADFI